MKACFPVTRDLGLDSPVSSHFGSAPGEAPLLADREACASHGHEHGGLPVLR